MNGYVSITLNSKKQGLKFGNFALIEYSKLNGTAPGEIDKGNYLKLVRDLIYCGLKGNYFVKGQDEDFTLEVVTEWVDNMDLKDMEVVVNTFTESMQTSPTLKKLMDAEALEVAPSKEAEAPKKRTGRKL